MHAASHRYVLTGSPIWRAATEAEREAVLAAVGRNTTIFRLELVNSFINDPLCSCLAEALRTNGHVTCLNLESNSIQSVGIEALAAMLRANTTLKELKLANQHLGFAQASEETFAAALEENTSLLHLTIDLRNLRARELINKWLTRNHELQREQRKRDGIVTDVSRLRTANSLRAASAPLTVSAPPPHG